MRYRLQFKPRVEKDLRRLPSRDQTRILEGIEALQSGLSGDIKRLTDFTPEYRLRLGDYRVLFEIVEETIVIYRVRHRRDAYR